MCCTCVGQCQEDTQRHGRGRICVCRLLCHWRSLHRLTLLNTLPPLSSATYLPPALDQLLPMQRFCDGIPSNHWMGCLSVLSQCMSLLQVVLCVQRSLCTQPRAYNVCAWGTTQYNALDVRWCMHGSRSIFWLPAVLSSLYRLVAEGEAYLLGDVGEG